MDILFNLVLATITLFAASYVHRRVPEFTNTRKKVIFTRMILIAVGAAFGAVSSLYVEGAPQRILTFLAAFGTVHVPAAVILLIKSKRRERRS